MIRPWSIRSSNLCLHQLIEEQAGRTPEQPALVFGEQCLSYGELDRRAGRLASYLRRLGVGPDVLVGLLLRALAGYGGGHSGRLKAGGAYVPLDPTFPGEPAGLHGGETARCRCC